MLGHAAPGHCSALPPTWPLISMHPGKAATTTGRSTRTADACTAKKKRITIGFMADTDSFSTLDAIALYADGSFSSEVGIGAWAFLAPVLNLEGVGSSEGNTVTRFEFLAVLHGLEAVAAVDKCGLPVHVFSDCDSTIAAIEKLRAGLPLKNPSKYEDRADLIPRLQAILTERQVQVTRYRSGRLEHQACHRNAIRKLRAEVDSDPRVRRGI